MIKKIVNRAKNVNECQIVAQGVAKSFVQGDVRTEVLRDVTIAFQQGHTYAIMGVSGTGKSTLMHILAGIDVPTEGEVLFNDRSLRTLNKRERKYFLNRSVGLLFQSPYLIRELSVLENVVFPALISGDSRCKAISKARVLLQEVGLSEREKSCPSALSGGQQQRIAIARALINKPAFLLADEPTGNLDIITGRRIVDLLLDCNKKWGMGLIITSHDAYVAQSMEKVFQLSRGQIV